MDEAATKTCPNCKREIPAVNFTIHTVHCARNIKVCPVCKEPVPLADLDEHHKTLHKLLPCKKCGESVCGTDLEDHVRDSCAHTIKSCRFCELELPRRELPAHEGYCGVRTEQCPECREWVMIKYRQLHIDSNHYFVRLNDDPEPRPPNQPQLQSPFASFTNRVSNDSNGVKNINLAQDRPRLDTRHAPQSSPFDGFVDRSRPDIRHSQAGPSQEAAGGPQPPSRESKKLPLKRTNDQPQLNTSVVDAEKVNKELRMSGGAVRKRQAPPPPPPPAAPAPSPRRDLPYWSAAQRLQRDQQQRALLNAHNLAQGLPPVLTPAAKLDKLRKMDALHNRETQSDDYKNRLQGRVWNSSVPDMPAGQRLGSNDPPNQPRNINLQKREDSLNPSNSRPQNPGNSNQANRNLGNCNQFQNQSGSRSPKLDNNRSQNPGSSRPTNQGNINLPQHPANINFIQNPGCSNRSQNPSGSDGQNSGNSGRSSDTRQDPDMNLPEVDRNEFRNLQPMTPEEFMVRFSELQLQEERGGGGGGGNGRGQDRINDIKSSLRELRRGLNEVTAPYNSNALMNDPIPRPAVQHDSDSSFSDEDANNSEGEVRLPCEFCELLVPADDLVLHETGCRPDVAQYLVRESPPLPEPCGRGEALRPPRRRAPPAFIPCEFCDEPLPVYLLSDHQERCRREAPLLYPD